MVFSNTDSKNGLIQSVEFWTRHLDAGISGNATLLLQITTRLNSAFEKIMPLLLAYSDYIRWDDPKHTSHLPIGTINLISGQSDYKLGEDEDSLDILNINAVRILPTSTATLYETLERMTMDDPAVLDAMSPNSTDIGIPTYFVENGDKLFLYPQPNYSATNGIKIFYSREQSYFTIADTSDPITLTTDEKNKEPGIPKPFHELLALYAALDWNMVNRTDDGNLISMIQKKIQDIERDLRTFMDMKFPTKLQMTMRT